MMGNDVKEMLTVPRQVGGDPAMYRMPQMYFGPGAYRRGYWDGYLDRLEKSLGVFGKLGGVVVTLAKIIK